jgi:hypothetical protein
MAGQKLQNGRTSELPHNLLPLRRGLDALDDSLVFVFCRFLVEFSHDGVLHMY